eukprot:scaffold769_cov178-Ochromonas_danica.AAC.10
MRTAGTTAEAQEPKDEMDETALNTSCALWSLPLPRAVHEIQVDDTVAPQGPLVPRRGRKRKVNVMLTQHYDLWLMTLKMDQEIDEDVDLSPPKERKRLNRCVHPFLPILKSDIRRDYPTMITNALNSLNADVISGFFYQFGVSSCYLENNITFTKPRPKVVGNTQGLPNIVQRIVGDICRLPDMVFNTEKAEILRHNYQAGSLLRLQINVSSTRLLPPNTDESDSCQSALIPVEEHMVGEVTLFLDNSHRFFRMEVSGILY